MNVTNRQYYKAELTRTVERLENEEYLNEYLLDELQAKIYLLMKHKYYPKFKNYPEFHKILLKNDLILKLTSQSNSPTTDNDSYKPLNDEGFINFINFLMPPNYISSKILIAYYYVIFPHYFETKLFYSNFLNT